MKTVAAMFIGLAAIVASTVAAGQTVTVTGGQIRGAMLDKGGAVFKGIPFAAPPVGELRWREPAPVKPWTGVRDATAFGAICAQNSSPQYSNAAEISGERGGRTSFRGDAAILDQFRQDRRSQRWAVADVA